MTKTIKTKNDIRKLISEVFPDDPNAEKEKLIHLLSPENRIDLLRDTISVQENTLDMALPLAESEAKKRSHSKETIGLKTRLVKQGIENTFRKYPKTKKTLGAVWLKFGHANNLEIFFDRETGEEYRLKKTETEVKFISDSKRKMTPFKKRSLQKIINEFK